MPAPALPALIRDGRGRQDAELPEDVVGAVRPRLGHENSDQLLLGIDPEVGAEEAAPVVRSRRPDLGRLADISDDGESEAEPGAGPTEPHVEVAGLVGPHELDGLPADEPDAIQRAAVQHHLTEARVVARRGDKPRAAGAIGTRTPIPKA